MAKINETYKTGLQQEWTDEETGEVVRQTITTEVIEGYRDVKLPDRAKFNNGNFITIFQNSMMTIAKNAKKQFTKDEITILLFLLGSAGLGNSIVIEYAIIAEVLSIQRTNAVSAIQSLIKKNIIVKQRTYRGGKNMPLEMQIAMNFDQLNYNLAYNGKTKDYTKVKYLHPNIIAEEKVAQNQLDIFDGKEKGESNH